MRRIGTWMLMIALAGTLVVGVSTGCSGDQQKAQEIIRGANPNVQKGNEQVLKLRDIWTKIQKLPDNPAGYKEGAKLAKEGATAAKVAQEEYEKVISAVQSAKKLDVSPDYKKYMSMKEEALKARVEGLTLSAQRFAQITKLYGAAIARNIKAWQAANARIKALSAKISKLPDSDKLDEDANAFGKKKGIGG